MVWHSQLPPQRPILFAAWHISPAIPALFENSLAQFVEFLVGREKLASIAQIPDAPVESNGPAQSMKGSPSSPDPANLVIDILAGGKNLRGSRESNSRILVPSR